MQNLKMEIDLHFENCVTASTLKFDTSWHFETAQIHQ